MNTKKNRVRRTWGWVAAFTAASSCLCLVQLAGQTPAAQAPAQAPAPAAEAVQAPGAVIKAESRLVLVDAVVTDKKGDYVHDLKQNDFKVYEDNKEQTVASFSFGADTAIQAQGQKRYMILFFDNSTMAAPDQIQARAAAKKFIENNAGPDKLMAVVDFGGTLRIVQNFTANANLLQAAVSGVKSSSVDPNAQAPVEVASAGLSPTSGSTGFSSPFSSMNNAEADFGARSMLLSLRSLAKNLRGVPGSQDGGPLFRGISADERERVRADGNDRRLQQSQCGDLCAGCPRPAGYAAGGHGQFVAANSQRHQPCGCRDVREGKCL